MFEHGVETKLKLLAILKVALDAMRPRFAGGALRLGKRADARHPFLFREARMAKLVKVETLLKLFAIVEHGIETKLKLFAMLEVTLDALRHASLGAASPPR